MDAEAFTWLWQGLAFGASLLLFVALPYILHWGGVEF